MSGPSPHLSWAELSCRDRLKTVYPLDYRDDPSRLPALVAAFEALRAAVGLPLVVHSAYRTPAYNRAIGGSPHSQHVQGRALDLRVPTGWEPIAFAAVARGIPEIRGVGVYATFVHIDVRPGRAVAWREAEGGKLVALA